MLKILVKTTNSEKIEITDELLVGRSESCGLMLTEGHVSRRHAMFYVVGDETSVEDLGSANGTFVNDQRIESRTLLRPGDRVRFDTEEFRYEIPDLPSVEEDADKTEIRSADEHMDVVSGPARSQPDWIDPSKHNVAGPKTVFIDPAELHKMMSEDAADVDGPDATVDDPTIRITSGSRAGVTAILKSSGDHGEWTIGSDADRDIVLEDPGISAVHAKLKREGHRWKLSDQMSTSGTFVNGKRSNVSFLADRDRLRFGPVECVFRLPPKAAKKAVNRSAGSKTKSARNLVLILFALLAVITIFAVMYGETLLGR